jgi:hypothetical protein
LTLKLYFIGIRCHMTMALYRWVYGTLSALLMKSTYNWILYSMNSNKYWFLVWSCLSSICTVRLIPYQIDSLMIIRCSCSQSTIYGEIEQYSNQYAKRLHRQFTMRACLISKIIVESTHMIYLCRIHRKIMLVLTDVQISDWIVSRSMYEEEEKTTKVIIVRIELVDCFSSYESNSFRSTIESIVIVGSDIKSYLRNSTQSSK